MFIFKTKFKKIRKHFDIIKNRSKNFALNYKEKVSVNKASTELLKLNFKVKLTVKRLFQPQIQKAINK